MDECAEDEVLTVTTRHLKTQDPNVTPVDFSSTEEKQNSQDEGIMILKLGKGQRIKFTATARLVINIQENKTSKK